MLRYSNTLEIAKQVAFGTEECPDGGVLLKCPTIENGLVEPEQVSGHVLRNLLHAVEQHKHVKVTKAVISVPAYFDERQREATVSAGTVLLEWFEEFWGLCDDQSAVF